MLNSWECPYIVKVAGAGWAQVWIITKLFQFDIDVINPCQTGKAVFEETWIPSMSNWKIVFEQRRWPTTLIITHSCSTYNAILSSQLNSHPHLGSPSPSNPHEGRSGQRQTPEQILDERWNVFKKTEIHPISYDTGFRITIIWSTENLY